MTIVVDLDVFRLHRVPGIHHELMRNSALLALRTAEVALRRNRYVAYDSAALAIRDLYDSGCCDLPEILALAALMARRARQCRDLPIECRNRMARKNIAKACGDQP